MKKKFIINTLGCRVNQYESQAFYDQLVAMGLKEANQSSDIPDICIVNSCSVTSNAEKSSIKYINNLRNIYPNAKIYVTGCLGSKIIGENIFFISNEKKEKLVDIIFSREKISVPIFSIKGFKRHIRAFVKIQDGCNCFCSYCIIPLLRGRSRSRNVNEILYEIETLADNNFKEIVLTGINIGDFKGSDEVNNLCDLIKKIHNIKNIERYFFMFE